jgi:predicted ATPase
MKSRWSFCEQPMGARTTRRGWPVTAAIALSTEQGFPLFRAAGLVVRGWASAASGRPEEGVAEIRRGMAEYAATGAAMWSPYFFGLLAEALGQSGQPAAGLEAVNDALAQVERSGARWIEAELGRIRGDLLLRLGSPDTREAERCFRRSLTIAGDQQAKLWQLRTATSLGLLLRERGNRSEAFELVTLACASFDGENADTRAARALLANLA